MGSEIPPTFQRGFGPTGAEGQSGPFPADIFNSLLATAGRASPLTQFVLFIYQILGSRLGPDLSVILAFLGAFWVTIKMGGQAYTLVDAFIENHLMHSVVVPQEDEIYTHVMKWLSKQERVVKGSCLVVQTVKNSDRDDDEDLENTLDFTSGDDEDSIQRDLNFSKLVSKVRHQYYPAIGKTRFWYENKYFVVRRTRVILPTSIFESRMHMEEIKISCLWSSRQPITKLLLEATEMYCKNWEKKTIIYRPKLMEHVSRATSWKVATRRPKRSMETIMLPDEMKNFVLNDMIEFLKPETARWYADRGIPWRRGYLFFGPPGTGKTSFVAAIAGHLGLAAHVLDLTEPHMTDANLLRLFRTLPDRRIVLIEDIDVSGIQRDGDSKGAETNRVTATRRAMITETFSLGGLLNGIDGVAAEEGRILIMTTNKRESLDEALTRPGRVDIQIEFHNATSQQSEGLFCLVYEDFTPLKPNNGALPAKKGIEEQKDDKDDKDEKLVASAASQIDKVAMSPEEIKRLSKEFSKKIPDFLCSPAEIQEFLLCRKKDPQKALDDVESWVEEMAKQKNFSF